MAIYAEGGPVRPGRDFLFEETHRPLEPVLVGGLFRCDRCGAEDVGRERAPELHAHPPGMQPVRWRLIVAIETDPKLYSLDDARAARELDHPPTSPAAAAKPRRAALRLV